MTNVRRYLVASAALFVTAASIGFFCLMMANGMGAAAVLYFAFPMVTLLFAQGLAGAVVVWIWKRERWAKHFVGGYLLAAACVVFLWR